MKVILFALMGLFVGPLWAQTPAPQQAAVYIISPANGDVVSSPVTVRFGLSGMGVAPAGVEKESTGHHHLLIDTGIPSLDQPVPADDHHKHFGGGQTEIVLELSAGEHSLQLLMADHMHVPHSPAITSEVVVFTVK